MEKNKNTFNIQVNKVGLQDSGNGLVKFTKPLTITDNKEQLNKTRYDIETLDTNTYRGLVTVNHSDAIEDIVGKVIGLAKDKTKVVIDVIKFAVEENAKAIFAKNMLLNGFVTDFSIETIGDWPTDEGVWENAKLVGLSMVIAGNNQRATLNQVVYNSITEAKEAKLNPASLEAIYADIDTGKSVTDNSSMDETKKDEKAEEKEESSTEETSSEETTEENKTSQPVTQAIDVTKAVQDAMTPLLAKIGELEQKVFDNSAREPEFTKQQTDSRAVSTPTFSQEMANMDYKERHGKQINAAWDYLKGGNADAAKILTDINKYHVEQLKKENVVPNQITIADFGNFVISPELLRDIEGFRSNFADLISRLEFRETLSLQMAWLKRSGDINMQEVEICDDEADGNLKPISEYGAEINQANLHELAAVTPVCNAATRFLAADLLGDVAAGYRNDYDRKRAQLFIARCQQAVDSTGNKTTYATTTDVNSLKSFVDVWGSIMEEIENGVFIFNHSTYAELVKRIVGAGISGPLAGVFTTGDQPLLLGRPYIVVPNELLPNLNTATTKSFTVEGVAVSITQAVFYADLSTFSGRTSGGLQYDLSTEAAYEVDSSVRSAFQRNELVLRGSFFRNGAIRDEDKVASLNAPGVS